MNKPPPPEILASALHDPVHEELPGVRAAKSVRDRYHLDKGSVRRKGELPERDNLDRTGINYGCADSLMAVFGMRRVDE